MRLRERLIRQLDRLVDNCADRVLFRGRPHPEIRAVLPCVRHIPVCFVPAEECTLESLRSALTHRDAWYAARMELAIGSTPQAIIFEDVHRLSADEALLVARLLHKKGEPERDAPRFVWATISPKGKLPASLKNAFTHVVICGARVDQPTLEKKR